MAKYYAECIEWIYLKYNPMKGCLGASDFNRTGFPTDCIRTRLCMSFIQVKKDYKDNWKMFKVLHKFIIR